jgi:phage gp46-like protein
MINDQPLTVTLDGRLVKLGLDSSEPLVRAVIISLFTWRRARPDDDLPGDLRMGWWGDSMPEIPNDRIGSRLWLLSRAKLTAETVARAREYAEEALSWLVEDGVAARVAVESERIGLSTLGLACRIYRSDGNAPLDIRFSDVWEFLNV